MAQWTKDEIRKIGGAEEIQITPGGRGALRQRTVTIWVVSHGDSLYVRSVRGPNGGWYRGMQKAHEGRIRGGGEQKDVGITRADQKLDDEIDAEYRTKYHRYAGRILNSILTPEARSTTLKLTPRSAGD
jgi:hypothetical protein